MARRAATRRQRRALRGTVTVALVSALLGAAGSVAAGASDSVGTATVVVQAGDSLWTIARDADPAADPRAVIAEIKALNGLTDAVIRPGQPLVVPAG